LGAVFELEHELVAADALEPFIGNGGAGEGTAHALGLLALVGATAHSCTRKCQYVHELHGLSPGVLQCRGQGMEMMQRALRNAVRQRARGRGHLGADCDSMCRQVTAPEPISIVVRRRQSTQRAIIA